jgi:hypothetical protein
MYDYSIVVCLIKYLACQRKLQSVYLFPILSLFNI